MYLPKPPPTKGFAFHDKQSVSRLNVDGCAGDQRGLPARASDRFNSIGAENVSHGRQPQRRYQEVIATGPIEDFSPWVEASGSYLAR
jgi:hypothetical protein